MKILCVQKVADLLKSERVAQRKRENILFKWNREVKVDIFDNAKFDCESRVTVKELRTHSAVSVPILGASQIFSEFPLTHTVAMRSFKFFYFYDSIIAIMFTQYWRLLRENGTSHANDVMTKEKEDTWMRSSSECVENNKVAHTSSDW